MTIAALGSLELVVVVAVSRLGEDAHGLAIRRDVAARTSHDYSVGAIYTTLQRLEEKGLLSSTLTAPLPVRGGRSRRQFKLTMRGRQALVAAHHESKSIWEGVESSLTPRPA